MDARITKHRLGNLLSYDWIKIIATVAAAVFALVVLFTIVGTRPSRAQEYYVHFYKLDQGTDNLRFSDDLGSIFSYEILDAGTESFTGNMQSRQAYTLRRSMNEGAALLTTSYSSSEDEKSPMEEICEDGLLNTGTSEESMGMFFDPVSYFEDVERYLVRFFGEDFETGELNDDEVRSFFLEKNAKDKRFRTAAKKERGVELEKERLSGFREDYLFVRERLESGYLTYVQYDSPTLIPEEGSEETHPFKTYNVGISLRRLNGLTRLCSYSAEEGTAEIVLLLYNNGKVSDVNKYESVSLLRYLIEHYA